MEKSTEISGYQITSADGENYTITRDGVWVGRGTLSHGCTAELGDDQDEIYDMIDDWLDNF